MNGWDYTGDDTLPEGWESATDAQREHYWLSRAKYQANQLIERLERPARQRAASQRRLKRMLNGVASEGCKHEVAKLVYSPATEWDDIALDDDLHYECANCQKILEWVHE